MDNKIYTDELLKAAARGDEDALTYLYNTSYDYVYRAVFLMVKNEDDTCDIMQECYIKAFNNLDKIDEAQKFLVWIGKIARNCALDFLRKRQKELNRTFTESGDDTKEDIFLKLEDSDTISPQDIADSKDVNEIMKYILSTLSDEQRIVVTMRYYDDMKFKQIAEIIGVSESTVKSRLKYATDKIKEKVLELEKKGYSIRGIAPVPFFIYLVKNIEVKGKDEVFTSVFNNSACSLSSLGDSIGVFINNVSQKVSSISLNIASDPVKAEVMGTASKKVASVVMGIVILTSGLTMPKDSASNIKAEAITQVTVTESTDEKKDTVVQPETKVVTNKTTDYVKNEITVGNKKKIIKKTVDVYSNDFEYKILDDDSVEIYGYRLYDTSKALEIPSKIDGHTVAGISDNFLNPENANWRKAIAVERVILPDTIRYIGKNAFNAPSVKRVTLSKNIEKIGENSFTSSKWFENNKEEKDGFTIVGKHLLYKCNLSNASIPNSIYGIYDNAFTASVNNITLPDKLNGFNPNMLAKGSSLKSIGLKKSKNFSISGGVLFNKNKTRLVYYPDFLTNKKYKTPAYINEIADDAFTHNKYLTEVNITGNVKAVGKSAFADTNIESVVFGDGVSAIKANAFSGTKIKSLVLPKSVKELGTGSFGNCKKLQRVNMDSACKYTLDVFKNSPHYYIVTNKTSSGNYVIDKKGVLVEYTGSERNIKIPNNVTKIKSNAFDGCKRDIVTSITLSNSMKSIGSGLLAKFPNVTEVTLGSKIRISPVELRNLNKLQKINVVADNPYFTSANGVLFNKNKTKLLVYPKCCKTSRYTVPDGVKSIDDFAFQNTCITYVKFPQSLKNIGRYAFKDSRYLSVIDLPYGTIKGVGICAFENTGFYNDTENWDAEGTLYLNEILIKCKVSDEYEVAKGTKVIADGAFKNCQGLTGVVIPKSVKAISNYAFENCSKLQYIEYGSIKEIGAYAFYKCGSLEYFDIPGSVQKIGRDAFFGTKWLKNQYDEYIVTGDSVLYMYRGNATHLAIPSHIKYVTASAFNSSANIQIVKFNSNIQYVPEGFFNGGCSLKALVLPNCSFKIENESVDWSTIKNSGVKEPVYYMRSRNSWNNVSTSLSFCYKNELNIHCDFSGSMGNINFNDKPSGYKSEKKEPQKKNDGKRSSIITVVSTADEIVETQPVTEVVYETVTVENTEVITATPDEAPTASDDEKAPIVPVVPQDVNCEALPDNSFKPENKEDETSD